MAQMMEENLPAPTTEQADTEEAPIRNEEGEPVSGQNETEPEEKDEPGETTEDRAEQEEASPAPDDPELLVRAQFDALRKRAESMRQEIPGFDLGYELQNPSFGRLVLPPPMGMGMDPEIAWYAVHHKEIRAAQQENAIEIARYAAQEAAKGAAEKAKQLAADAITSGAMRPTENGSGSAAPAVTGFDPRALSRDQRKDIIERARRGERIVF